MATRSKRKTTVRKGKAKKAPGRKAATRAAKKVAKKAASKKVLKAPKKIGTFQVKKSLPTKSKSAVKDAAEALWAVGSTTKPHELLQELHEVLLLRCLDEAEGNYAGAAALFGPSRQSVQQYANSQLRDARWKPYQQNRRKKRVTAE